MQSMCVAKRHACSLHVVKLVRPARSRNLQVKCACTACQQAYVSEEEEEEDFYKLWPANKTDALCQSWQ